MAAGGLGLVFGCQSATPAVRNNQTVSTVQGTAASRPSQTPTAQITATVTPTEVPEDTPITLTFWTVEPVSPMAEGEAGNFFQTSLDGFERANPSIKVDLLIKKASGKGGILDFLRTSRDVAPSILPDVVVMNTTDLNQAYADGLLQSLSGRLDRSIVQDLLPAARRMGTGPKKSDRFD